MTKIMIFVDGSNLYWSFRNWIKATSSNPAVCNVKKMVELLTENRELIRAYFFCSIKPSKKQDNQLNKATTFLNWLKLSGIEAVSYPLKVRDEQFQCPRCGLRWKERLSVEKGVDVALVTKLLALGFKGGFDTAIIVSGDADYIEAVKEVKNLGRRIEVAAFKDSASKELVEAADRFIPLDDFAEQIKTPVPKPERNPRPNTKDRRIRPFGNRERSSRY